MTKPPIPITITKLEMTACPATLRPHLRHDQDHGRVMLLKVRQPPVHFYRYLYETVGKTHVWVERTRMSDEALAKIVQDEKVEIYVLYCEGAPAGYAELDFRKAPHAELAYFGLIADFLGRGLGSFLLATAIDIAWSKPIERLWVHTNTLDHPRALPLYQKMGFVPYAQEKTEIVPL
ncbi:MAG: GNAT family N-acetyltransferase [Alphaproteobacteria bacterium]|nr:GNAT family N-acetyltransferase [Alphaproteobacteria bacterium]